MVEQKAEVVLIAERKSVTAKQRRLQTIFQTCCAPVRNIILHLFKKFEKKRSVKERKCLCAPNVWSPEDVEVQP
jgi:hypothetical protein